MSFTEVLGPRHGSRQSTATRARRDFVRFGQGVLDHAGELPMFNSGQQYTETVNILLSWHHPDQDRSAHLGIETVNGQAQFSLHYSVVGLGSPRDYYSADQLDEVLERASWLVKLISSQNFDWQLSRADLRQAVDERRHGRFPLARPPFTSPAAAISATVTQPAVASRQQRAWRRWQAGWKRLA